MIVCHCHVVSDRDITAAIASGAGNVRGIARSSRAGSQCGGCLPGLRRLLAQSSTGAPGDVVDRGDATRVCS